MEKISSHTGIATSLSYLLNQRPPSVSVSQLSVQPPTPLSLRTTLTTAKQKQKTMVYPPRAARKSPA